MAGSASWKELGIRAPWVESWASRQGSETVDITTSHTSAPAPEG